MAERLLRMLGVHVSLWNRGFESLSWLMNDSEDFFNEGDQVFNFERIISSFLGIQVKKLKNLNRITLKEDP